MKKLLRVITCILMILIISGCSTKKEFNDDQNKLIEFSKDYISDIDYSYDDKDWTIIENKGIISAIAHATKNDKEIKIRCDWTSSNDELHFVEIDNKIIFDDGYLDTVDSSN